MLTPKDAEIAGLRMALDEIQKIAFDIHPECMLLLTYEKMNVIGKMALKILDVDESTWIILAHEKSR